MGRPRKNPADKYRTPSRQLGRISDANWELLQLAAKSQDKTFTRWATDLLLQQAKRDLARQESLV